MCSLIHTVMCVSEEFVGLVMGLCNLKPVTQIPKVPRNQKDS
jgi:hypothetical protein